MKIITYWHFREPDPFFIEQREQSTFEVICWWGVVGASLYFMWHFFVWILSGLQISR